MNYREFEALVHGWAEARGIYELLTWQSQLKLYYEECYEAQTAKDEEELITELGDRIVCLINCHRMYSPTRFDFIPNINDNYFSSDCDKAISSRKFDEAIDCVIDEIDNDFQINLFDVYQKTWDKISKRRGMVIGDKWRKWSDLNEEQRKEAELRGI